MAVSKFLNVVQPNAGHDALSHSFSDPAAAAAVAVEMMMLPSGAISTRAMSTPAFATALTARVTSHCLNLHAPRFRLGAGAVSVARGTAAAVRINMNQSRRHLSKQ